MRYTIRPFKWPPVRTALMVMILAACSGNYGTLRQSNEVDQAFQNFRMIDDYKYFYSGRTNVPTAIVGIDPAFEFGSQFWTIIEPDQFQTMVGRVSIPEYGYISGAYVLTPDGRRAGVWYSWVGAASVRFDGNRIIIAFRDPTVRRF